MTTPTTLHVQPTAHLTPDVIESVRLLHGDRAAEALIARSES